MAKKDKALTNAQIAGIVVTAVVVIGLWGLNWYLLRENTDGGTFGNRGTFGDMFGAINALFSGLAFAGIIFTILLQRNELELQREELRETRQEYIEQNRTLRLQRFENTFFNMLNLQNEIVKNLQHLQHEGRKVIDLDAKRQLYAMLYIQNFRETYGNIPQPSNTISEMPENLSNARALLENKYFPAYYDYYSNNFNHYFRNLYHIFKFIYFSELDVSEKNFYASICRAQLSQNELFVIAFNAIIEDYGRPNFLYLIKEFDILQNFEWGDIKPEIYRTLIRADIRDVNYPFKMSKPKQRNLD